MTIPRLSPSHTRMLAVMALALGALTGSHPLAAEDYTITTLAGRAFLGSSDGTAAQAEFFNPWGIATDAAGNTYVADLGNHTIRKITSAGVVSTLAGMAGIPGAVDGLGAAARFDEPMGIAIDASGTLFVTEFGNHAIRRITPAGEVSTFVGNLDISGSSDGADISARFSSPAGLSFAASGELYVADYGNHTIRMITAAGVVTTLAGTAGMYDAIDGTGAAARFKYPMDLTVAADGNVYVVDTDNHNIRTVTPAGVVTTLAGNASYGHVDGTGNAAQFFFPRSITHIGTELFVADDSMIRKVTTSGVVTTVAGTSASGSVDGTGTSARFGSVRGIDATVGGTLTVSDYLNHNLRSVTTAGVVTTLAGTVDSRGSSDGLGSAARFYNPQGVAVAGNGTLYIADTANHCIRKITTAGVVTTFAGSAGNVGSNDGTAAAAQFYLPYGVAVANSGTVYVADSYNHVIRKITAAGIVTTLAGSAGITGTSDGTGVSARFYFPFALAVDDGENIYVADAYNHTIRKITAAGVVTTLAGSAGAPGATDGTGTAASFTVPTGITVSSSGMVYVAGNQVIRQITPSGVVTTIAGSAGSGGSTDGTGSAAHFVYTTGITVDGSGTLFVVDRSTIRKITSAGVVTTVAGTDGSQGSSDGLGPAARFCLPNGIAQLGGVLYIADSENNTIRKGTSPASTLGGSGSSGSSSGGGGCGMGAAAALVLLGLGALIPLRRRASMIDNL